VCGVGGGRRRMTEPVLWSRRLLLCCHCLETRIELLLVLLPPVLARKSRALQPPSAAVPARPCIPPQPSACCWPRGPAVTAPPSLPGAAPAPLNHGCGHHHQPSNHLHPIQTTPPNQPVATHPPTQPPTPLKTPTLSAKAYASVSNSSLRTVTTSTLYPVWVCCRNR